ncbi:MAG: NAD(P)/FAD-dependent oxidoreductase [Nitrospira sp.]
MSVSARVIIVGAGLAGLTCAQHLVRQGLACTILEASDEVGGRVRTDRVDGFQLDRGFQVLLTGYPEATNVLDYPALQLQAFHPGALVHCGGRFHRISDPLRRPQDLLAGLMNPIGSFRDKLTILRLRQDALNQRVCAQAGGGNRTTLEALASYGFSAAMRERFLRPFLGGVFLDPSLSTPCRLLELVWAAFSRGAIALPQAGMGAIAGQLVSSLPAGSVRLRAPVAQLDGKQVLLTGGGRLSADAIVLATDYATAATLRGDSVPAAPGRQSTTLYFDAPAPPVPGPWLLLNGEQQGPIGTACVLSEVAPTYAPPGRALVSVSLADQTAPVNADQPQSVRAQLREWFGPTVDGWRHLRTDRISGALPPIDVLVARHGAASPRLRSALYQCGDYCETGTLDGALLSGRHAADAILADL